MLLTRNVLDNKDQWIKKGYDMPAFDWAAMCAETAKTPAWVHFGAGNIFRAFLASVAQEALNSGSAKTGIVAVEGYDFEIIDRAFQSQDSLTLLAILRGDRKVEKSVLASVAEALKADPSDASSWSRLQQIFEAPSLQMASFTITEKGYNLAGPDGTTLADVAADFAAGPGKPASYIGKVASLLYHRYQKGGIPLAMVSMDNCSGNGDRLKKAMCAFAEKWCSAGLAEAGFAAYVNDPARVSFPWTMIDKITPRPDAAVQRIFQEDGFEGLDPFVTAKHTYIAPFVNAEKVQYLVIEDCFPNDRPLAEGHGVFFTDRDHVAKVERMKVTVCLNPLHTALALYGCLLGYTLLSEEMKDADLKKLVERLGYQEGLPVVVNPGILEPMAFLREVIEERIPNPYLPDSPQRIAVDTSQKLSIRFGETIKEYVKRGLPMEDLVAVPLTLAGWLRYLLAMDDEGMPFELSPDPMLAQMREALAEVRLGDGKDHRDTLKPLLSNPAIFGTNLYEAGLGERVEGFFRQLCEGPGAVRRVLSAAMAALPEAAPRQ